MPNISLDGGFSVVLNLAEVDFKWPSLGSRKGGNRFFQDVVAVKDLAFYSDRHRTN